MEIREEDHRFWCTLEKKSENIIPPHIKNLFHINGFSNERAFQQIDNRIVAEVEKFCREELMDLLESMCVQKMITLDGIAKTNFFGQHSADPQRFCFNENEKELINKLVRCVEFCDLENALSNLNLNDQSESNELSQSSSQWYFECHENYGAACNDLMPDSNEQLIQKSQTHYVLNKLLESANQNVDRPPAGYRFNIDVKRWAAYLRMLAGPLGYVTLQKNLALALPSLSSINRFIQGTNNMIEGILRSEELLLYLKERNLPLVVSLSEDATRIDGRVQYHSRTNQLVGFVLPMNEAIGMPVPFTYKATCTEQIVTHFTNETRCANFVNTVMAQPIGNAPSFCLLIFGTDSRYNAENVSKRWKYITAELDKLNIEVLTISSDSEPKFNSAMRKNSQLGNPSNISPNTDWFSCGQIAGPPYYVQDTIHIGTKMRNFFLKTLHNPNLLPFGSTHYIRIGHLQYLIDNFPKDKHQLTATVLNPIDRQNFQSVQRICNADVASMLKKCVDSSEASVQFLEIMRNSIDSFMDVTLMPLERVYKSWNSLFMIRLWRIFVVSEKNLTLKVNFLSANCYSCLEQNAHSLLLILSYLRKVNKPHLFIPILFSSQPCESFYRQIRSFTSTFSTVANCTVKEILERINKIQLLSDIGNDTASNFLYPQKLKSGKSETAGFSLPSEMEIFQMVEKAKQDAINDAIRFKLIREKNRDMEIFCKLAPYKKPNKIISLKEEKNEARKAARRKSRLANQKKELILSQLKAIQSKNYTRQFRNCTISYTSQFTEIFGCRKRKIVKKTFLCWFLRKNVIKLSSDRLERVKDRHIALKKRKQLQTNKQKNGKKMKRIGFIIPKKSSEHRNF